MKPRHTSGRGFSLAAVLLLAAAGAVARGQSDRGEYELLIERSPLAAGVVTPDTGLHRFAPDSTISLKAKPEPGYRFAYWLGDVSDPTAEQTTVHIDNHKVVIAVFQPEPRDRVEDQIARPGGGGDFLAATATDLAIPSWATPRGNGGTITPPAIRPEIVTPEPTTIALLGLGILALRRRTH